MDCNGHIYPSEYALRFANLSEHPATYKAVVDDLRRKYPGGWPELLGTLFAHRGRACWRRCGRWTRRWPGPR